MVTSARRERCGGRLLLRGRFGGGVRSARTTRRRANVGRAAGSGRGQRFAGPVAADGHRRRRRGQSRADHPPGRTRRPARPPAGLLGGLGPGRPGARRDRLGDRKSTRLNSSHVEISYAVFCLKKKKEKEEKNVKRENNEKREEKK